MGGFADDGGSTPAVEIYDTVSRSWTAGPDLPLAVHHAMATSDGTSVYVVGGYETGNFSQPGMRAFVLEDGGWQELPPMPQPRAAAGAAVIDGRVYVAGGIGANGLALDLLVYDIAGRSWTTGPGPPTPREHLGVAATGGRLYVLGGRVGGLSRNLAAAEVFDPSGGGWSRLADMPTARGGVAAAATTAGLLVVPGGEEPTGTFDEVEALDAHSGRWSVLPPLPTPRHGLGVVAVGDVVYVLAGGPEPGFAFSAANEAIEVTRTNGGS